MIFRIEASAKENKPSSWIELCTINLQVSLLRMIIRLFVVGWRDSAPTKVQGNEFQNGWQLEKWSNCVIRSPHCKTPIPAELHLRTGINRKENHWLEGQAHAKMAQRICRLIPPLRNIKYALSPHPAVLGLVFRILPSQARIRKQFLLC